MFRFVVFSNDLARVSSTLHPKTQQQSKNDQNKRNANTKNLKTNKHREVKAHKRALMTNNEVEAAAR